MNMEELLRCFVEKHFTFVGICFMCKRVRSIDVFGNVDCEMRERVGPARIVCKDFKPKSRRDKNESGSLAL